MLIPTLRLQAMHILGTVAAGLMLCCLASCNPSAPSGGNAISPHDPSHLRAVNLSDVSAPSAHDQPVMLRAASNEWTEFTLQATVTAANGYWLRVHPPRGIGASIPVSNFSAYQILPMPVDMDRAGYVRHTGKPALRRNLPRALLPQPMESDGTVNLATFRNPAVPTDPRSHAGGPGAEPTMVWFDLHVPKNTPAGDYEGSVDLMTANNPQALMTVPIHLTVYDFELPDERHLQMVGQLGWDRLEKLYPAQFEAVTPSWVNRREGRYQQTVRTLDHLVALAQENRANLIVPALKPIVKWPAGEGPQIDWDDFDSMLRPWFSGDAFKDRVGLGYWPMPEAELLNRYDRPSQLQYWTAAAAHFDSREWLVSTAVSLESPLRNRPEVDVPHPGPRLFQEQIPTRLTAAQCADLSTQAAEILNCNPALRVLLPLEDDQVKIAGAENAPGIDPSAASRLLTASAALVSAPLPQPFRAEIPRHWLRTDLPGLVPYIGAGGDERDVRVWAWLAFLRHLDPYGVKHVFERSYILWSSTLPLGGSPEEPADPGELVWFYPGQWFGTEMPVPTVQLKWLRRAQQDYEYLILAQQRGETINALQLARLITKPVELQPGQTPDPVYGLMTGTTSQQTWDDAHRLLADTILLRPPGQPVDVNRQQQLYIRTLQLSAPQERRLLVGRSAEWSIDEAPAQYKIDGAPQKVDLKFSIDIYNASETTPDENRVRWAQLPNGWEIRPQELVVPRLEPYRVQRAVLRQKFNLDKITAGSREPMELQFIDGFTEVASPLRVVLPVARSDYREGRISIDGSLDDWSVLDTLHDGPMVKMFSRPALQHQELQLASTNSRIYTTFARENFYIAFDLEGLAAASHRTQNFVDYQQRRAWGEDLSEILIQPITPDNKPGPVLHIVCKPNGGVWVERKTGTKPGEDGWKTLESTGLRYAATTPETNWRGEVAIPWSVITGGDEVAPYLLRFNFAQHRAATGESATWAGPVDFGRDDSMMGLIYLKAPQPQGVQDVVRKQ